MRTGWEPIAFTVETTSALNFESSKDDLSQPSNCWSNSLKAGSCFAKWLCFNRFLAAVFDSLKFPSYHPQAIQDPLGGMPLLSWFGLVFFQNGVDHADPRFQLGPLGSIQFGTSGGGGLGTHSRSIASDAARPL